MKDRANVFLLAGTVCFAIALVLLFVRLGGGPGFWMAGLFSMVLIIASAICCIVSIALTEFSRRPWRSGWYVESKKYKRLKRATYASIYEIWSGIPAYLTPREWKSSASRIDKIQQGFLMNATKSCGVDMVIAEEDFQHLSEKAKKKALKRKQMKYRLI